MLLEVKHLIMLLLMFYLTIGSLIGLDQSDEVKLGFCSLGLKLSTRQRGHGVLEFRSCSVNRAALFRVDAGDLSCTQQGRIQLVRQTISGSP